MSNKQQIAVGVDVTASGTHITLMAPTDTGHMEVIYSEFHPMPPAQKQRAQGAGVPDFFAMAKVLSDRSADACNIDRADNWAMHGQDYVDDVQAMLAERDAQIERLQMQLVACGVVALANTPGSAVEARQMHPDYMSASCSDVANAVDREIAMRQQRDKLAEVLGNVEREHDLIRQMKNCEIHRGRGSFGIAVMSDPLALEWQALDKKLQQLIDARHTALAETNRA